MYLLIFGLWLLLNGKITLEICLFGVGLTVLLGVLCKALFGYTPKKELRIYKKLPLFAAYLAVLVWEILKANIAMLRYVWGRKKKIAPVLVTFQTSLHSEFARFMLANSITLTPGTITVETRDNIFTVHCLCPNMIEGIETGTFVRLLKKLEA